MARTDLVARLTEMILAWEDRGEPGETAHDLAEAILCEVLHDPPEVDAPGLRFVTMLNGRAVYMTRDGESHAVTLGYGS